jgi:hypothetical protein
MTQSIPRQISSYNALEKLGRVRLSENFFMREFLYSSIGDWYGLPNYPEDPQLAVEAGTHLCQELLEPLKMKFGHVSIRSAYRSPTVNGKGAENNNQHQCSSNEASAANHIWDLRDGDGNMGACATVQIPWFMDNLREGRDWTALAWWIHDYLPYHSQYYFRDWGSFNLTWRENPERWIKSYVAPKGTMTKPGMDNHTGDHSEKYAWFEQEL